MILLHNATRVGRNPMLRANSLHAYVFTCLHASCVHAYMHLRTCLHACMLTRLHACMLTRLHAYMLARLYVLLCPYLRSKSNKEFFGIGGRRLILTCTLCTLGD